MTEYYWAKDKTTGKLMPVEFSDNDVMSIGYEGFSPKTDFRILGRIKCPSGYRWKYKSCVKVK